MGVSCYRCWFWHTIVLLTASIESLSNAWFLSSSLITKSTPDLTASSLLMFQLRHKNENIPQQQQHRRMPFWLSQVVEGTDQSITDTETSIKIRAMAAFLSISMLESMLAAGAPTEKLAGMTSLNENPTTVKDTDTIVSSQSSREEQMLDKEIATPMHKKEGDRKFALQDEFSPSITTDDQLNQEVNTVLHKKEGDRIVALQDGFAPEQDASSVTEFKEIENAIPANDSIERTAATETTMPATVELDDDNDSPQQQLSNQSFLSPDSSLHPHYIPPVPNVISAAFGRPLTIITEHVPPLRQLVDTIPKEATPSVTAKVPSAVADEDPYGE
jgi:hypothetical protein